MTEIQMIAVLLIALFSLLLLHKVTKRIEIGKADTFNEWQRKNYRIEGDLYYKIHPPNKFETARERKIRYRRYCDMVNNVTNEEVKDGNLY